VDVGWFAVRTRCRDETGNSWSDIASLGWEATVKDYGVAVAIPQGQSRMPNLSTEHQ
jgi:hypothetical protein